MNTPIPDTEGAEDIANNMLTAFGPPLLRELENRATLSSHIIWKLSALLDEVDEEQRCKTAQQVLGILTKKKLED